MRQTLLQNLGRIERNGGLLISVIGLALCVATEAHFLLLRTGIRRRDTLQSRKCSDAAHVHKLPR